jgi:hypothetical protein
VQRLTSKLFDEFVAEILQDGRCLSFAAYGADHEVVGDQRDATNIEQDNVAGLLIGGEIGDAPSQAQRFGAIRRGGESLAWPTLFSGRFGALLDVVSTRCWSVSSGDVAGGLGWQVL